MRGAWLLLAGAVAMPAAGQTPGASTPALPTPAAPSPTAPGPTTPGGPSAPDSWVKRVAADVIMLDKLSAQPTTLTIKVGGSAAYGTLTIAVRACDVRPPDLPQNAAAFLEITDSRGSAPVFHGWVLSNTPSVSQFEHPVYDLRLASCR